MMGSGTARADNGAQWREERDALRQRVAELEAQLHQANASVGRQLRFTKALLAAIPTPVFFKDAQGYYIGCNDAFTEQMGVSAEEIKGKTTHDLWPSAYAEAYHQKDMELMQHPERQVYESRVYDKTGQDRHVILTKGVFYDESDQVAGLVGAYVDITERKRAEAALRESQALFQSLVESMPQNVFSKDLQGRFTFANRQYCKTIGRSLDDILGKTDVDLHPLPLAHKYRQDDRQVMQQRRVFQTIEEHQVLEGEMRYVQVVKAPLFDAAGQVSGVLGIFWDVTESVRMQEALRQSEENLATTLHAIGDGVIATDENGRVVNMNPVAEKLCGWTLADAQGRPLAEVFQIVNAETRATAQDPVRQVFESGKVIGLANHTLLLARDGAEYQIADSAAPIRNRAGEVTGVVLVFRDVTQEYATALRLRESEARLDLAMAVKNEGIWDWNLVTNETYFDDRYYTMAGYTPNAFPQNFNAWAEHVHPEDLPRAQEAIEAHLTGKSNVFDIEFRFKHKDNSWIWIQGRGKIVERDADGSPLRMIGTHTDITTRKQAEEALRESEAHNRAIIAALPDFLFRIDADSYFVDCRANNPDDLLLPPEQVIGRRADEILPPALAELTIKKVRQTLTKGAMQVYEYVLPVQDEERHFEARMTVSGPRSVLALVRDVTDRKRAEKALQESEEKYRTLVKNIPIGVYRNTAGPKGRFLMANPAFLATFGFESVTELAQVNVADFYHDPSKRAEFSERLLTQGYLTGVELLLQRKDGTPIWGSVTARVTYDAEGKAAWFDCTIENITERKQAEEALRASEARYRSLIEQSNDAIYVLYGDQFELINPRFEALFGVTADQVRAPGFDFMSLVAPSSRLLVKERQKKLAAGQKLPPRYEFTALNCDGDEIEVEVTVSYIAYRGGLATQGILRDVTERKQAEEALRQERDFSRALADAAALISRTLDPDEVLDQLLEQVSRVVPNDATNIMLIEQGGAQVRIARWRGYERFGAEEFISTAVFDLDAVPNLQQMIEADKAMIISDTRVYPGWVSAPEQAWVRSYAGAPIRVRGVVVGLLNVDSATPDFFTSQHADILCAFAGHAAVALENARLYRATQQELVERKRTERALRASEERYRRLFERSNDAIFVVDRRTGRYRDANAAAEKLTGRSCAELQGLTTLDVTPEGAQERLMQAAMVQQTLEMGEVYYLQPDGVTRTASLHIVPLNEQTVFGIARDITGRKEMEERLQRQERLAAIGQLAAGIAHDFRNLLTTVILYARLGQRHPDLPPAVSQRLDVIVGEAHKATDLVRQILDFGRRTEIDRRPLDLVALVGDVVTVLARTLPENIHITFDNEPSEACIVEGDAGRLQQVLTNLALNARDAMPGGGDLYIGVTRMAVKPGAAPPLPEMEQAGALPAWICLSVVDTGMGMSEEVRAHLFEPFFTTKEAGQGTGLGLAQVYGIVQLHAGYIDVETAVGQGVAFRIYLPAAAWVTEEAAKDAAIVPPGQGETLLLVEDNAYLREAGQSLLTDLGYRVLTAANGREALALDQAKGPIALLITDLVMPEMGGKALLQALHSRAPDLKALAMTGYMAEESVETLRAAGFLEVIRKPFDADRLARAVRRALDEG